MNLAKHQKIKKREKDSSNSPINSEKQKINKIFPVSITFLVNRTIFCRVWNIRVEKLSIALCLHVHRTTAYTYRYGSIGFDFDCAIEKENNIKRKPIREVVQTTNHKHKKNRQNKEEYGKVCCTFPKSLFEVRINMVRLFHSRKIEC